MKNANNPRFYLSGVIALLLVAMLLVGVFPYVAYANNGGAIAISPKINYALENKNDLNDNKIQDDLEEDIRTMNTTDKVNVLVTLAPRDENFIKFAETYGAKIEQFYTIIDAAYIAVPVENITKMASYPAVEMIYKDRKMQPGLDTSVSALFGDKTTLQNSGFDVDGSGTTIAIIDSGTNITPALTTLPDGKTSKVIGWKDFIDGKSSPFDPEGHGTGMASIAAGVGRPPYFAGVAPGAQLVIVRGLGEAADTGLTPVFNSFQWILDNKNNFGGIDVLSLSIRQFYDQASRLDGNDPIDLAVDKLVSAGIVVVVLAGNEGPNSKTIGVPGTAKTVITVGAVDDSYNICTFSSRGPTADGRIKPDLCAIGAGVRTLDTSRWVSGTSEATPHVAGTVALLLQYFNEQLGKYNSTSAKSLIKITPAIVKDILIKSASQPSRGSAYPNNNYGNGILNIKNALATLKNKNYLPMAQFTTSGAIATINPISFDASGSIDPNGDTLTYVWDFGDGSTGSGKTTTHIYSTAKEYTVTLTVRDSKNNANDFGLSANAIGQLTTIKKLLNVVIGNALPIAKITANGTNINKGGTLNFSPNEMVNLDASKSSDPDGQVATVSWNMGDGIQKSGKTITHSYAADGKYDVVAKIIDDKGGETQFDFIVSVANKLPIANIAVSNTNVNKGDELTFSIKEEITLDASSSSDPDGQVVAVSWSMGDGIQKSGKTILHSYLAEGNYPVIVVLTDNRGGETTFTFTINIGNGPPVADIRMGGNTISNGQTVKDIIVNKETEFDASHSFDREGSIKSITWDMGDSSAQKSGLTITHTYTSMNTYNVVVKLTDNVSAVRTFSFKAEVSNAPPVITQTDPIVNVTTATKKTAFQFNAPPSSDPNGNVVGVTWDFGDGTTSSEQNPTHKYERSGTYTVTYTVTDDAGATANVSTNVTITKSPPVANAGGNVKANIRDSITFDASRSYSPDGEIVGYLWRIGDNDYTESTIPYRFSERGDYTVTLTVTDDEGLTNATTISVNVANMPPAAVMSKIPETVNTGDAVEFKATSSFDFDGEIDRYAWNFGDGKTGTGKTTSHVYEKPGTYKAALTVYDNDGETNTTSFSVSVNGFAGETYAYVGGIAVVCVIAVVIAFFYIKPSVFGKKREASNLKSSQTMALQQSEAPPPPPMAQSSYNVPYQTQSYQPQSTRPPDRYLYTTKPSYPTQSPTESSYPTQAHQYGTCPACGGAVQIPTSTDGYPVRVVCPSCGAESTIE
ncbi:MAG: PKD domain-containing protein [Thermoplasmata archaeon]